MIKKELVNHCIGLNLGPKSSRRLVEVGIQSVERLREIGSVEAYRLIHASDNKNVSKNLLWALEGAIQGRHHTSFTFTEKQELLVQLGEVR